MKELEHLLKKTNPTTLGFVLYSGKKLDKSKDKLKHCSRSDIVHVSQNATICRVSFVAFAYPPLNYRFTGLLQGYNPLVKLNEVQVDNPIFQHGK